MPVLFSSLNQALLVWRSTIISLLYKNTRECNDCSIKFIIFARMRKRPRDISHVNGKIYVKQLLYSYFHLFVQSLSCVLSSLQGNGKTVLQSNFCNYHIGGFIFNLAEILRCFVFLQLRNVFCAENTPFSQEAKFSNSFYT